ncbi:diaminopropionate ammonia-lyase [Pseudovibrio axinellae]|uniref:Diaminopropionate ammonia-lyase n=1 Tax=Pseudovibrio axinellae TaxID=989403 RepID=A0A165WRD6_9HYPH|nr:hypothetical protein [Pseudovibrio axinellae]KZL16810.1 diaminopropionate ammonia-lyase [Pseudovibrio axinellae]SER68370.1 diaminopropionate ammonia-lyase [Pseudovibrio axinellae]
MKDTEFLSFSPDFAQAMAFFQAQENYKASPLLQLHGANGQTFLAKDETNRMGLGAFKALGAPLLSV